MTINNVTELFHINATKNLEKQVVNSIEDNPEAKKYLKKQARPYNKLMTYYKCAMMEIETKFRVLNEEFTVEYERNPIVSISSRLKSPESLVEKLNRRNIPLDMTAIESEIDDIAGVRVVCAFPEDIYMITDCLLKQDDVSVVKIKDYVKNPKENGYRSLHLIVKVPIFLFDGKKEMKVEVQIRTIAMNFWASLEHRIRYKKNIPDNLDLTEINEELKKCAEESALLDLKMDKIRQKIEK